MRVPLTPAADHEIMVNRTTPIDINLLGPGKTVNFDAYVKHYKIARKHFNGLLATPYLGSLSYKIGQNPEVERKNLGILIQNGAASLRQSAENDIARVNELKIYAQKLASQLEFMPVSTYIRTMKSSVEQFKNDAVSHIATRTEELNQLKSFVSEVSTAIAWTTYELDQLAFQLRRTQAVESSNTSNPPMAGCSAAMAGSASILCIDDAKAWKILISIVQSFTDDLDVSTFMSMLLGISTIAWNTLVRKWQEGRKPEARRQFGRKLRKASTTLLGVRQGLNRLLSVEFPTEIGIDIAIYELWGNVLANMEGLSTCETRLTGDELKLVKKQWEDITNSADAMLKILTLGLSDDNNSTTSVGEDAKPAPTSRVSNINDPMANSQNIRELLQPPKEMDASLKKLQSDCKNILREFDAILSIEGLQHLVIDNPRAPLIASVDSQPGPGPDEYNANVKWPLWDVVKGYRQDYNNLETDCRQLIRKLKGYSSTQKIVLPKVEQGGSQSITLSQYVTQNKKNIGRLKNMAIAMEKKHRDFNLNWEFLQKALQRQLTEEEENFNTLDYEAKLKALPEEQKKSMLYCALQGIGGLLSFKLGYHTARSLIAAAGSGSTQAVIAGMSMGVPAAVCLTAAAALVGGWMLYTSVQELEKSNQLGEALKKLKLDYQKCLDRIKNLQVVSTLSKGIHDTLRKLSKIFHGLGNNLTDCLMHTSQTDFFNALKPELIAKWKDSEELCICYLRITARCDDETTPEVEASTLNSEKATA